jgi:hypothetical protein
MFGLLITGLLVGGLLWLIGTVMDNREKSRRYRERQARYYARMDAYEESLRKVRAPWRD